MGIYQAASAANLSLKNYLAHPRIYQGFQEAAGFFGARIKAIDAYLPLKGNEKVLDIGCGPGFIVQELPEGCSYVGFDPSPDYIRYASRHFGNLGEFVLGFFDEKAANTYAPVDVVMLNGVLHHMTDAEADEVARLADMVLRPGGRLFTLDGCFVDGQNPVAKRLLSNDRGRFVRQQAGYEALLKPHFSELEAYIDHRFSWVPYTFISMVGHKR